ncbi:MAG TPA: exodeoxyribonuclease VII small subunit [candidate division Zixibacteria bacterium]|nr:exodeoxyribonuclease VII small subunit [candidate division Zixibacteria bacterium]
MKDKFPEPESFESAMSKLEEVLRKLESGQVSLEGSLEVYSEAKFLAGWCYKKLSSIQGELKKLGLDENGGFSLEEFPSLD